MKNNPLVSVILPTYNGGRYIKKSVQSVLFQTLQDFELIIINDGSTDETPEILSGFASVSSKIHIIENRINVGFVKSLNEGIEQAIGKYIARIDDDDIWFNPKKLEKQIAFLENHSDYVLVGGGIVSIDTKGREIARLKFPERDEDIRNTLLTHNVFAHSTVLFRKSVLDEYGGYENEFGFFSDHALWLKIGRVGKMYNFQEHFSFYVDKEQDSNYSGRNLEIRRKLFANLRLRMTYRTDYPGFLKAIFFVCIRYVYSFLPMRQRIHLLMRIWEKH